MASQNFTAGHATWCRSKYSYDDECSCGLDGALEGAGERQADSAARAAREAADRREKGRAEEQAFWDRAFCAALTGLSARVCKGDYINQVADDAATSADLALSRRRARASLATKEEGR